MSPHAARRADIFTLYYIVYTTKYTTKGILRSAAALQ